MAATLVPLATIDRTEVERLLDLCFGQDRHARTAYRIREGAPPLDGLCFAALDEDERLTGSIEAWPVGLADPQGRIMPLVMVGPVAVAPGRQGEGFGKGLMAALLGALEAPDQVPPPQLLIGEPSYYGRWGFSASGTEGWACPGPVERERLLVRCRSRAVLPAEGMLGPWQDVAARA
jgi:predicted N-acetyltransferase YhbS